MLVPAFETPAPPHSKAHAPALPHPTSQFAGRMSPGPKGPVQGQSEEFRELGRVSPPTGAKSVVPSLPAGESDTLSDRQLPHWPTPSWREPTGQGQGQSAWRW